MLVIISCSQPAHKTTLHDSVKSFTSVTNVQPLFIKEIKNVKLDTPRMINSTRFNPEFVPEFQVTNREISGQFVTSPSYEPRLIKNATITEITKVKLDATKSWAAAYFIIQSDTAGGRPISVSVKFNSDSPVFIVPFDFTKKSWVWSSAISSDTSPISMNIQANQQSTDGYSFVLAYLPSGTCMLEKNSIVTDNVKGINIGEPANPYGINGFTLGPPTIEDVCAIPGGGVLIAYKSQNGTNIGSGIAWAVGASPDLWKWSGNDFDTVKGIQHIRTSIIGGRLAFFITDNAITDHPRGTYSISDDSSGTNWSTPESIEINGVYCTSMVDNIDNIPNIMTYGATGVLDLLVRDTSWKKLTSKLVFDTPDSIRRTQLTIGSVEPYELLVGISDPSENGKYGISYFGDTGWTSLTYPLSYPLTTPTDGYTNISYLSTIGNYPAAVMPGIDPKDKSKLSLYYSRAIEAQGLNWTTSRRIPNTSEIELDKSSAGTRYRFPHAWTLVEYQSKPIVVWADEVQTSDTKRNIYFRCAAALDTEGNKWAGPRAFKMTLINPGDRVELFAIPVTGGIVVFHELVSDKDPEKYDIVYTFLPITVQ